MYMKLAWLSDIHLNYLGQDARVDFARAVAKSKADAIVMGGDLGEADSFGSLLQEFTGIVAKPTYFVLGNHDYYGAFIDDVRRSAMQLSRESELLTWLPAAGVVALTEKIALIGHGGWADTRYGNYQISPLILNDYFMISDFNPLTSHPGRDTGSAAAWQLTHRDRSRWQQVMVQQADNAAELVDRLLQTAISEFDGVVFLTHVPPFREACLHNGEVADDIGLPHFSSKVMGDTLKRCMDEHPSKQQRQHQCPHGRYRIRKTSNSENTGVLNRGQGAVTPSRAFGPECNRIKCPDRIPSLRTVWRC